MNHESKTHSYNYFNMKNSGVCLILVCCLFFISGCQSQSLRAKNKNQSDDAIRAGLSVDNRSMTEKEIQTSVSIVKDLLKKGYTTDATNVALRVAHEKYVTWTDLYHLSKLLSDEGLFDQVIQVLEKTPDVTQNSPPLLLQLCAAYYYFEFYKESWISCERATTVANDIQLAEQSPLFYQQILLFKAKVAYQLQKDDDLTKTVNEMLGLQPDYCEAHYLLGKHYYRRSQIQASLGQLEKMDPGCQQKYPQSHLLIVLGLVKNDEGQKALTVIDDLLKISKDGKLVKDLQRIRSRIKVAKNNTKE